MNRSPAPVPARAADGRHPLLAGALALACSALLTALPAQGESLASSASSAGSASVGSSSDSIQGSSDASSGPRVAQGEYRIERVAELPALGDGPARVQLQLVPVAGTAQDAGAFLLALPRETAERERLVVGDRLRASTRPYGLAFTRADRDAAFFLVLEDGWRRELDPRAVVL
jgi:hypothetical protein